MNDAATTQLAIRKGHIRYTSDDETFDIRDDRWAFELDGNVRHIKWGDVRLAFSPELVDTAKEVAAELLLINKSGTVTIYIGALRRLALFLKDKNAPHNRITANEIETFFADQGSRKDSALRPFFLQWRLQGHPGLDEEAWVSIKNRAFKTPDRSHITTLHPETGPYLDSELIATDLALRDAFEKGDVDDERYLLAMTFRLYGQRPIMVANLKCGDVRTPQHDDVKQAEIRFPLAKKRNSSLSHGPGRPAPMLFTHVLERYLTKRYAGLDPDDRERIPLFPARTESWAGRWGASELQKNGRTKGFFAGHCTAKNISSRFQTVMDGLDITSPRTQKPMVFNPMRERHTVGTLMAMKGCSAEEIAAWLHHDDLGSCEAYVELGTRHHQLMHSMLDGKFTHLAGRFLGELIPDRQLDNIASTALISDTENPAAPPIGGCATGGCKALDELAAPYACLDGCPNLQLSIHADLRPLIEAVASKKSAAKAQGNNEYHEALNRSLAQIVAAEKALMAARSDKDGEI